MSEAEQVVPQAVPQEVPQEIHGIASIRRVVLGECRCGFRTGALTPPGVRQQLLSHINDIHRRSEQAVETFKAARETGNQPEGEQDSE